MRIDAGKTLFSSIRPKWSTHSPSEHDDKLSTIEVDLYAEMMKDVRLLYGELTLDSGKAQYNNG
jgi:hypothetical protein